MMPRWIELICTALTIFAVVLVLGAFVYALFTAPVYAAILAAFAAAIAFTTAQMKGR